MTGSRVWITIVQCGQGNQCGTGPTRSLLDWLEKQLGHRMMVTGVRSLHDGESPWWIDVTTPNESPFSVVLRSPSSRIRPDMIATNAAALAVAEKYGLPAPRLLASDLDGRSTGGVAATLETALPGSSALPGTVTAACLKEAGAAIARVHAIPLEPQADLPLRTRPTQVDDRAMERRWATLYQASTDVQKPAVVAALRELTGWGEDTALRVAAGARSTPLLQLADERIREIPRPQARTVFVHGDVWWGNMRWDGETCLALIDWKIAGAGDPGVDLGELRMQMAIQYGLDAPAHVLDGWERQAGRTATNVPYWDAVAALNTPVTMDGWPGFDTNGQPLDTPAVTARRDAFLRGAFDAL
ncbi:phosphotransferase family protein [Phytohabitans sp. LJ34]|uniref:phosphotransferase family protein n=1 Tax=Phytohabitans sp. LJ34 TaxID=3452217 RepID=UPI003F88F16B